MEQMDLNESYVFTKVVQAGSFIKAAQLTGIPKQTVSAKVAALEGRLGVTLLKRTTRKLSLTEAGTAYYEKAIEGVHLIQTADAEARKTQSEVSGTIRLTVPLDFCLTGLRGVLGKYVKRYPGVEVDLFLSNRYIDMVSEGVDVAIRFGDLKDSSMIAKKLGVSTFIPVVSPRYLKDKGRLAHPKDLKTLNCLRSGLDESGLWEFRREKERIAIKISGNLRANHLLFLKELALQGEGVARIPYALCSLELKNGRLVRLFPDWVSGSDPIHAVYPAQRFVPRTTQSLVEVLSEFAGDLFPEVEKL